jgi:tetratricopeptide (TPR) repeat protein
LKLQQGHYEAAVVYWRRAISAAPTHFELIETLFHAAIQQKDAKTAEEALEYARKADGFGERWGNLVSSYGQLIDPESKGLKLLRRVVTDHPRNSGCKLVLARQLLSSGFELEAMEHFSSLATEGNAESAFYLGVNGVRDGRFEEALKWTEYAYALNPHHLDTQRQLEGLRTLLKNSPKTENVDNFGNDSYTN